MVLLFISVIIFNLIALRKNKIPTMNRKVSIWTFTIAFQVVFDTVVEFRYGGYWYFEKGVDWLGLLAHTVLIPPINILILSWFPFKKGLIKKGIYIISWTVGIMLYEKLILLPDPWGFFHLGWWKLWYEVFNVPILILALIGYYKLICKLEKKLLDEYEF